MIDRNHELPIARQAKLLQLGRGSVYYLPRPTSAAVLRPMRRIDELHLKHHSIRIILETTWNERGLVTPILRKKLYG